MCRSSNAVCLNSRRSSQLETERGHEATRAQVMDSPGDISDVSVADEGETEAFTEAELDATVLQQVRDALRRMEEGTFGRSLVDGGPIGQERFEAV